MKYDDARLLLRFARLQLEVAIAKNPTAEMNISPAGVQCSVGYRKLRAWFLRMSKRKRVDARRWLETQCRAIEMVKAQAKATGEDTNSILADIEILQRDDNGLEVEPLRLPDARDLQAELPE